MTKPTPFFILAIVAIVLAAATFVIVTTAHNAAIERQARELLATQNTWQPPKIDCPAGMELWDCIRHGRYE